MPLCATCSAFVGRLGSRSPSREHTVAMVRS